MGSIAVVGIGPGDSAQMTNQAKDALDNADVIIGYTKYIELLGREYDSKVKMTTGMRQEVDRCRMCYEEALEGKRVALICSGDAGIYGMASLIYELGKEYGDSTAADSVDVYVVPGITAASSGAALIGAPINHDFCTISLSDLMTPWEVIEKRLECAALGDFAIALYNPSSMKRSDYLKRACDILLRHVESERACGYVRNIGRDGCSTWVGNLGELKDEQVDMFTTCFIGNSRSYIRDGKLVTPRGYTL